MGHREDLLEGAKRCLLDKGYARTTAREIVAASGANLASIGYHYGSKEALLNQAFIAVTADWGDAIVAGRAEAGRSEDPMERFEAAWEGVIGHFGESRALWKLQFEMVARIDQDPELKATIAQHQRAARDGLAEVFQGVDPEKDPEKARVACFFYHAMLVGVMAQWFIDHESAPSAKDLTEGLRAIVGERAV